MSRFFIDRPIFAWVIAIITMLAGTLSIFRLPIAQYPAVAAPAITVTATAPGASATTVDQTVTQVIEQQLSGLDGLRYILSSSDSSGAASIELTFEPGTDPDIAQVQVQNKLQLATPRLPLDVQRIGITVAKSNRNFLLIIGLVSADRSMDRNDIADFAASTLADPLSRVPGVGNVQIFGSPYAMRIWLNPVALAERDLTANDVSAAVTAQNAQVSAGQFGGTPSVPGQQLNATITAQTRLSTPREFEEIVLRVNPDGSRVLLGDVARVELTGESFDIESYYNRAPATGIAVRLAVGANALDTADAVRARLAQLEPVFPPGLEVTYPLDSIPFIKLSIEEVVKTLLIAIGLVFLVMFVFLQNFRATLIPTLAVPVVLLGTFGVLAAFGYSINTLTMFAMVLAIGLLVDDAIVVVENVERVMAEENLPPREATRRSMDQITGALVGIALVLAAVFIPMAFFSGSVGVIYRQFSITIVSAMALSVLMALIYTPALCATILKRTHGEKTRGLWGLFNRGYTRTQHGYSRAVGRFVRRKRLPLLVYVVLAAIAALLFFRLPGGFLPPEDQGNVFVQAILPPGATQEQTRAVMEQVADYVLDEEKDAVEGVFTVVGFTFIGRGQNAGLAFVKLRDWDERHASRLSATAVAGRITQALSRIPQATIFAFQQPPIPELGAVGGFQIELEDRAGLGHERLVQARNEVLAAAAKHPELANVRPGGLEDRPEFKLDVDNQKATAFGLSVGVVNAVLSATWGSAYINDFIDRGRTKRVFMQGDAPYRMQPSDLRRWYVRNASNEMVPFSSFATGRWQFGPPKLDRFNGFAAMTIQGEAAPGRSTGDALSVMDEIANELPAGFAHEWYGLAYEERIAGAGAPLLYALSILVVFLCLAALYESWTIPVAVLMILPLGLLGTVIASLVGKQANDVYFQVGLLAVIGLAAKNAILIVEFAKDLMEQGRSAADAAVEAAHLRLRPIIMTSLAFLLGVFPLAISSGAGSGAQNAIGIAIVGGVIAATTLGVLLVPVFFVLIARRRKNGHAAPAGVAVGPHA